MGAKPKASRRSGDLPCRPKSADGDPQARSKGRHPLAPLGRRLGRLGLYQALRPLVVGMVHGLAGSAGVALLVLATIPDPLWGSAYLVVVGAGTVAGMMLITAASALPFAYTAHRFAHLNRCPALTSGVASIGLGLFVAYQVGVADGLCARQPAWTPQ